MNKYKTLVDEIRGAKRYRLATKETRKVNFVRLKVHYLNCDEAHLLQILQKRYETLFGDSEGKFKVRIEARRLNLRTHNTWRDIEQMRYV